MQNKVTLPQPKLIEISRLKPYSKNIKMHPKEQIDALAKIISEFPEVGFAYPVIIDDTNTIIAGHGRLEAAKLLGMSEIPYILAKDIDDTRKKAYMVLENEITNMSPYNRENMVFMFQDLQFDFKPFHMDFTRFGTKEETQPIPEVPVETNVKLGDVYQLGRHRVMCGDCREKESLDKLIGHTKIHQVNIDPPYGVDYASKNKYLNAIDKGNRIQTSYEGDKKDVDWSQTIEKLLSCIPFAEYNSIYIWCGSKQYPQIAQAAQRAGCYNHIGLVWVKNTHVLGRSDYQPMHEICWYGWKDRHKFHAREMRTTVFKYDKPTSNDIHPTMKPIELIQQCITDTTLTDENVLDTFLGSGTTLIACEQTGRICYGMEIDPHYISVVIQRWQNYTGNKAVKI
jgi:site-specific DNA-methyltransferase (adenine-specific)